MRLTVNSRPTMEGSREITFRPIDTETNLIYLDWITQNRERVDKLSDGRIGYIHIPDMGADGMREFIKQYFGQVRKEGLIVDVRDNGGGFISQTLLERLGRKPLAVDYGSASDDPTPYPAGGLQRPHGLPDQRGLRLGRRHLPLHVPREGHGAADRHPHLGRRRGHLRPRPADRRRPDLRARSRLRLARRANGSSKATASIPTSWWRTIRSRSSRGAIRSSSGAWPR